MVNMNINGKQYNLGSANNITIRNDKVIIDGCDVSDLKEFGRNIEITINGNITNLDCDGSVTVQGDAGSVSCGGSCDISGDVTGKVSAGGSVDCGNVAGSVYAGGSVSCRK